MQSATHRGCTPRNRRTRPRERSKPSVSGCSARSTPPNYFGCEPYTPPGPRCNACPMTQIGRLHSASSKPRPGAGLAISYPSPPGGGYAGASDRCVTNVALDRSWVGSAGGAHAARLCKPDWRWFPPAAASIRASGFPAHGSPTFFTAGIRLPGPGPVGSGGDNGSGDTDESHAIGRPGDQPVAVAALPLVPFGEKQREPFDCILIQQAEVAS
jgi:hypothetical protein